MDGMNIQALETLIRELSALYREGGNTAQAKQIRRNVKRLKVIMRRKGKGRYPESKAVELCHTR